MTHFAKCSLLLLFGAKTVCTETHWKICFNSWFVTSFRFFCKTGSEYKTKYVKQLILIKNTDTDETNKCNPQQWPQSIAMSRQIDLLIKIDIWTLWLMLIGTGIGSPKLYLLPSLKDHQVGSELRIYYPLCSVLNGINKVPRQCVSTFMFLSFLGTSHHIVWNSFMCKKSFLLLPNPHEYLSGAGWFPKTDTHWNW